MHPHTTILWHVHHPIQGYGWCTCHIIIVCGWFISDMKWEKNCRVQEEAFWIIWDEIPWIDALFYRSGSMAKPIRNIFQLGKLCCRNIKKIRYVGM